LRNLAVVDSGDLHVTFSEHLHDLLKVTSAFCRAYLPPVVNLNNISCVGSFVRRVEKVSFSRS
jgi:hypothetical protein